jgi:uncharacterized protein YnzC (UPF0291/DUF896 family)
MISPETQQRIDELRQKSRDNTITREEMREALTLMRGDRVRAAATSKTSRAKKQPVNSDNLLSELDNL